MGGLIRAPGVTTSFTRLIVFEERKCTILGWIAGPPWGRAARRETIMWNVALAGVVAAAIAGSSVVYAQQQRSTGERGSYPSSAQQDWTDSTNVRDTLASLKERLRLTPEQEKNWSTFESAYRALSDYRRERMKMRQERGVPSDPAERMRQRAESLTGMGAALARLADAEAPLYSSLSDDQKRQFAALSSRLAFRSDTQRRQNENGLDSQRDRRGSADCYEGDHRAWHHRDEDDRTGWDGRDRRGWRDRDDYDLPGWRGRRGEDRRGDDYDRRGWRDRDDYDHPGWQGQRGEDRYSDDYDRRGPRDRDDYDHRSWRGRRGEDRRGDDYDGRGWRDRGDYDHRS